MNHLTTVSHLADGERSWDAESRIPPSQGCPLFLAEFPTGSSQLTAGPLSESADWDPHLSAGGGHESAQAPRKAIG